jgi:cardiolipin synthase C
VRGLPPRRLLFWRSVTRGPLQGVRARVVIVYSPRLLSWIEMILIALGAGIVLIAMFGKVRLPPQPVRGPEPALPPGEGAWLDQRILPQLAAHPGESGFRLVIDGVEAFALRALSARTAERSLDLQYYIWRADVTGLLLIRELLHAADRGVRVRMLLDDLDAHAKNFALAALDAHPNIEVRIFNPFATREGVAGKIVEAFTRFSRVNRRMHNKTWIADNRLAIAGGRNVGDEYFAASEAINFVDLDYAMVGPVVERLSAEFDRYWSSGAVWSMSALNPKRSDPQRYAALRERSQQRFEQAERSAYVQALSSDDVLQRLAAEAIAMHWSDDWQVLVDDPLRCLAEAEKADQADPPSSSVLQALNENVARARTMVTLVSAYFVPGERGCTTLAQVAERGVTLSILTNSLAATDVAAVHGGYAKYRPRLIRSGAKLWELKPEPTPVQRRRGPKLFGSSGASLHTKAAIFDREGLFVGSYNIDPRSANLNCEQGVLVHDVPLASQAADLFQQLAAGPAAWRVTEDPQGALQWDDGKQTVRSEPSASLARRIFARIVSWLPVESQL